MQKQWWGAPWIAALCVVVAALFIGGLMLRTLTNEPPRLGPPVHRSHTLTTETPAADEPTAQVSSSPMPPAPSEPDPEFSYVPPRRHTVPQPTAKAPTHIGDDDDDEDQDDDDDDDDDDDVDDEDDD